MTTRRSYAEDLIDQLHFIRHTNLAQKTCYEKFCAVTGWMLGDKSFQRLLSRIKERGFMLQSQRKDNKIFYSIADKNRLTAFSQLVSDIVRDTEYGRYCSGVPDPVYIEENLFHLPDFYASGPGT